MKFRKIMFYSACFPSAYAWGMPVRPSFPCLASRPTGLPSPRDQVQYEHKSAHTLHIRAALV